ETVGVRVRTGGLDVVIARYRTHDRRLGRGPSRMQGTTVALGASAVEDYLALLLKPVQLRVRIRKRSRAGKHLIGEPFNPARREQRLLKSRQVVKHARRRLRRDLSVCEERAAGLFLKRSEP